jgi:excinuclease ABC subunit C
MPFKFDSKRYPDDPGVYRMLDDQNEVIYIGKAKNLRKRLSQYFIGKSDGRFQIDFLVKQTFTVETIATKDESDALILENQLIKREKPKYNIRLKDDKTYPYVRLSKDEFPRIEVSRNREDSEYQLFGPYTQVSTATRLVEFISTQYGIRRCPGIPMKMLDRPCLYAQIGQCSAPCVKKIDSSHYAENVSMAERLLKGDTQKAIREAKDKMEKSSEQMQFEQAAHYRDTWKALESFEHRSVLEGGVHQSIDIISCIQHKTWNVISLLQTRKGQLWNSECFQQRAMQSWLEEMPSFLIELYSHRDPPKRILIDDDLTEPTALENLLSQRAGYKVQITQPQRGELKSWLSMARQNAKAEVSCREATGHLEDETYLERIQDELQLPNKPMHAIALDCAIFSLEEPVGSIVVFSDGKIDKSKYRKFKVKGEYGEKGDVYAVEEVLERYLKRNLDNWPDVMLIDGGLQQLNAAANVILRLGYTPDRRLLSISKGEKRKRGEEQLHIYGEVHPRQFGSFPMSERFLTELRDEAHRTSNLFNGQRLIKERLKNPFLIIPGIGQQTAKKLRHAYGTMIEFEKSNPDKLKDIQGITSRQQKMLEVWIKTHRDEPK